MLAKYKIISISLKGSAEVEDTLLRIRIIAARDGWSFSRVVYEALKEYADRHERGNAQMMLTDLNYIVPSEKPRYLSCRHAQRDPEGVVIRIKGEFHCMCDHNNKITVACDRCRSYRGS